MTATRKVWELLGYTLIASAALAPIWPLSPSLHLAVALFDDPLTRRIGGGFLSAAYVLILVVAGRSIVEGRPWPCVLSKDALPDLIKGGVVGLLAAMTLVLAVLGSSRNGWLNVEAVSTIDSLLWVSAASALAAGIGEELLLRGILQPWLERRAPIALVVFIQGVVFVLLHQQSSSSPLLAIWYFVNGCAFSLAAFAYKTLWMPIAWHTIWNFSAALLFFGASVAGQRLPGLLSTNVNSIAIMLPLLFSAGMAMYLANRPSVQARISEWRRK